MINFIQSQPMHRQNNILQDEMESMSKAIPQHTEE